MPVQIHTTDESEMIELLEAEVKRLGEINADLFAACEKFIAWDENPHSTEAEASDLRVAMAVAVAKGHH